MTEKELLERIEQEIGNIKYPAKVGELYTPISYTIQAGGKRLRPLLCLKCCESVCENPYKAMSQAVAIEMFHNFTLIHDDVMDKSLLRRGSPTVFAEWGSTQAILSGDALLTLATSKVVEAPERHRMRLLKLFNKTALEVYEGQQLDIEFERRDDVTTEEYIEMIRLKTSVLLGCSCAMGALCGDADDKMVASLYTYGEKLGLAFQLRDDWLDTFGNPKNFGKAIGGDIKNRKKTWLFITAFMEAPHEMSEALKAENEDVVQRVKAVYEKLDLSSRCYKLINRYCDEAIGALENEGIAPAQKQWLKEIALRLCDRDR